MQLFRAESIIDPQSMSNTLYGRGISVYHILIIELIKIPSKWWDDDSHSFAELKYYVNL